MSSGLDNIMKPIEMGKKDWVEYEGVMYSPRTVAALKAAKTRKRNKEKKSYNNNVKRKQRNKLIKLMDKALTDYDKKNIEEYRAVPSILLLESPELLFIKQLEDFYSEKKKELPIHSDLKQPYTIYIPNNKEHKELKNNLCLSQKGNWFRPMFDYRRVSQFGITALNESFYDFMDTCRYGTQETAHIFKHGTWVKNIYPKRFELTFIWADFCGAFSKHMKDIELTFRSRLLCNHSIFALTFSTRDPIKKKTKHSSMNTIVAVQDYVKKVSEKYGYKTEFLTEHSGLYKQHMYTAIFHCIYEPIEKNKDELVKMLKTYYDLQAELKNRFNEIKEEIKPRHNGYK